MSWDWHDRELLDWAKTTLPEFMLISMQDPENKDVCIARTPWGHFEVSIAEVEVDGECNLIGKKEKCLLQFDIDLGMRIDIFRREPRGGGSRGGQAEGEPSYWPGLVQLSHFENQSMRPALTVRIADAGEEVAKEVEWYIKEGMGKNYIWHGLARWHAYAVRKFMGVEPPAVESPYTNPEPPPHFPPFREEERRRYEEEVRLELLGGGSGALFGDDDDDDDGAREEGAPCRLGGQPLIGRKAVDVDDRGYESEPQSGEDEEEDFEPWRQYEYDEHTMEKRRKGAAPKLKKFSRYPFLPSMLVGVGGPATSWLPPKEHAAAHPEWFTDKAPDSGIGLRNGGVTNLDLVLNKAKERQAEFEKLAQGRQTAMRAAELCDAIDRGEIMKAFARLDEETARCPHPDTGRSAAHYCVARGNKEMLQMVVEARADVNLKDPFGQTALMLAAKQGSTELSRVLLDAGADAAEEDVLGRSAGDMVKVKPLEPDDPFRHWREKLNGDPIPEDPAKKMHDLKSMIDGKERPKKHGLMLISAINQKDLRTAEASIEAGGDVNLTDEKGDSPLLILAKSRWKGQEGFQVRLAERAVRAGAKLDFQNGQGNSALLFAAHRGSARLAEALLGLRADASLANAEGNTALMYAAHGGHEAICTALLEASAPAGATNQHGLTAEQMAQRRGFRSCGALIHAYELAPKKPGAVEDTAAPRKKERRKGPNSAFDYSRWNALEKEMREDEEIEENVRQREAQAAMKKPAPKMDDLGPEAFGLPADTPWPPSGSARPDSSGPFDYSRWDKVVDDIEKHDKVVERYEDLQRNPKYEWKNGQKMQVIF